jgi:hypothetical protein
MQYISDGSGCDIKIKMKVISGSIISLRLRLPKKFSAPCLQAGDTEQDISSVIAHLLGVMSNTND